MHNLNLYGFRQEIRENNIILSFEGTMSQGVLTALIDALREKFIANNMDSPNSPNSLQYTIRKICAILVELAQNIQNHSSEQALQDSASSGLGIIVIREDKNSFTLTSGNNVLKVEAENLASYCGQLNSLDEVSLKVLYKEKLRKERAKNVNGGGIGLIELRRKSGQPLEYTMQPINDKAVFFSLSVNLDKAD